MCGDSTRKWNRGIQNELTRNNILDLALGNIPAIYIRSFINEATAASIRQVYSGLAHGYYKDVIPKIKKIGPTVFEHTFADRERYFAEARETGELFSSAMKDIGPPLRIFQRNLQEQCGWRSQVASDHVFGEYFAGTLRSIEEGTPVHIDFAPHESPGWEMIGFVESQLAANVYLDVTSEHGDLVIYDKFWTPDEERYRFKNRFGYDDATVRGKSCEVIKPTSGSMVLFNSRFFHRVEATWQRRLTYSFFCALHDGNVIHWS
jgi:hypothetical protein